MDSIIYRPSVSVRDALADYIHSYERETLTRRGPRADPEFWFNRERSLFTVLLARYVVEDERFNLKEYNDIQRKVLTGRVETRGRRAKYSAGWSDVTFRHALRHHLLDELVAKALGAKFEEPRPVQPREKRLYLVETLDMLSKFEELTEYTLPRQAYILYTREERAILWAKLQDKLVIKNWQEEDWYCVKFEEYIRLRADIETQDLVSDIIFESVTNLEHVPEECIVSTQRRGPRAA